MWIVDLQYTEIAKAHLSAKKIFGIQRDVEHKVRNKSLSSGYDFNTRTRDIQFYYMEEGDARRARGLIKLAMEPHKYDIKWKVTIKNTNSTRRA